jgi:hypothetical protein
MFSHHDAISGGRWILRLGQWRRRFWISGTAALVGCRARIQVGAVRISAWKEMAPGAYLDGVRSPESMRISAAVALCLRGSRRPAGEGAGEGMGAHAGRVLAPRRPSLPRVYFSVRFAFFWPTYSPPKKLKAHSPKVHKESKAHLEADATLPECRIADGRCWVGSLVYRQRLWRGSLSTL